jgi:hypothetical protein
MNHDSLAEWTPDQQNTFNTQLGQLTASAGFQVSWIENLEFILFCQEFVNPTSNLLSQKVMTHWILPTIKREFQKKAQASIRQ